MATVRVSQFNRNAVINVINNMRDKEMAAVNVEYGYVSSNAAQWAHVISRAAWGEHLHLMSQMPTSWTVTPSRIDLHLCAGIVRQGGRNDTRHHMYLDNSVTKISLPPGTSLYSPDVYVSIEDVPPELLEKYYAHKERQDGLRTKYGDLCDQVLTVIDTAGSFNAAVKAVPEIAMYLPQEIRDKMEEKSVRATKKAEVAEAVSTVDRTLLATVGVTAMLGG